MGSIDTEVLKQRAGGLEAEGRFWEVVGEAIRFGVFTGWSAVLVFVVVRFFFTHATSSEAGSKAECAEMQKAAPSMRRSVHVQNISKRRKFISFGFPLADGLQIQKLRRMIVAIERVTLAGGNSFDFTHATEQESGDARPVC